MARSRDRDRPAREGSRYIRGVRSQLPRYWPRIFGGALLLLVTGSVVQPRAHGRAEEKGASETAGLLPAPAVLPQTAHKIPLRSSALLPADEPVFRSSAPTRLSIKDTAPVDGLHTFGPWRPNAARAPPFPA